MATVKKIKKAANGMQEPKPTYKNLKIGVNAKNSEGLGYTKQRTPTSQDSAEYRFGFSRGLRGEKEYPGEGPVKKMGRWEGQNAAKAATTKKKAKAGASLKPVDSSKNPGLSKLPTPVRNKMGYQKFGGKTKPKAGCMSCGGKMKKK